MLKPSDFIKEYRFNPAEFEQFVAQIEVKKTAKRANKLLSLVDLTSLSSTDNKKTVLKLLQKAKELSQSGNGVAAACFFSNYLTPVKEKLPNNKLPLAVVAGAFPLGQADKKLKLDEVEYAVSAGANEVDFVINRGDFLRGNLDAVFLEIRTARQLCEGKAELKVIIENCDLETPENIYIASQLALEAGAHFIKTSTGKGKYGARPEDFWVMCEAVKDFQKNKNQTRGIKVAGGIRTLEEATVYYEIGKHFFGKSFVKPDTFRIGASSLVTNLETYLVEDLKN